MDTNTSNINSTLDSSTAPNSLTILSPELQQLIQHQSQYAFASEKFLFDILKFRCTNWQSAACHDYDTLGHCAWSTGSGVGKTALLARLILHFLYTRPYAIIPCTAPTQRQLYNVLWAEIGRAMSSSTIIQTVIEWQQERVFFKTQKDKWFAVAITSAPPKPGAMTTESLQGYHAENILFIVDECSGVADQILGAADGAMSTPSARAILASNPTRNTGYFHRATNDPILKKLWAVRFVDAETVDASYIDKKSIQRLKLIYGENSDYFRMRVRGLPPRTEFNALISPEQIFNAHKRTEAPKSGKVYLGVDPARYGDDDTVIYIRDGNVIVERIAVHGLDTMQVATAVKEVSNKYDPVEIRVDVIGIGSGVVDKLKLDFKFKKYRIIPVHVGEDANDKNTFFNRRSEINWQIRTIIDSLYIPFDTNLLDEELTNTHYGWDSKDKRIKIEPKDSIKANLSPRRSPNDLDALCLVCADLKTSTGIVTSTYFKTGVTLQDGDTLADMKAGGQKPRAALDLATFLGSNTFSSGKVGAGRYGSFTADFSDSFGNGVNDTFNQ